MFDQLFLDNFDKKYRHATAFFVLYFIIIMNLLWKNAFFLIFSLKLLNPVHSEDNQRMLHESFVYHQKLLDWF